MRWRKWFCALHVHTYPGVGLKKDGGSAVAVVAVVVVVEMFDELP